MEGSGIRRLLSDELWDQVKEALQAAKHSAAGAPPTLDDREFLEAMLYLNRTGLPWRDLPSCFGNWNSVYQRFRRWEKRGVWERFWREIQKERFKMARTVFIDSTVIRAHPHAAGAPGKKGGSPTKNWDDRVAGSARRFTSWPRMNKQQLVSS